MTLPRTKVVQPTDESFRLIPLTRDQVALVDVEDYASLAHLNWQAHWSPHGKTFYATTNVRVGERFRIRLMHRLLLSPKPGQLIDHINGNTLDNRRSNLRLATHTQNMRNSKVRADNKLGVKGVGFHKSTGRYHARIIIGGKQISLGLYASAEEAAEAYRAASLRHFGEFSLAMRDKIAS